MKPATSLCRWRRAEGTRRCTNATPAIAPAVTRQTTTKPRTTFIISGALPFANAGHRNDGTHCSKAPRLEPPLPDGPGRTARYYAALCAQLPRETVWKLLCTDQP